MNKKIVYGGILIAIIIATVSFSISLAVSLKEPKTIVGAQGIQGPQGEQGPQGPAGRDGKDGKDAPVKLGAVSGPNTYFDFVANNDLQKFGQTVRLTGTAASTTVAAQKSPSATSTLTFGGCNFTRASTTATVVTLAKATTAFATTTFLGSVSIAANAQGYVMATTSLPVGSAVFSPNTYFVVGMQDATPDAGAGTFSPVGTCSVEWTRI